MSYAREQGPLLPPRGFVRLAWHAHRALYASPVGADEISKLSDAE